MDGKVINLSEKKLITPQGQEIKTPLTTGDILCIYAPLSWPFTYSKFFKSFVKVIHPNNMIPLRKLNITNYFHLLPPKFPVCLNRNLSVLEAKKHSATKILFLDADMEHPSDIAFSLARHKLPIVAGVYYHQSPPHFPVLYKLTNDEKRDKYTHFVQYPKYELFEVDMTGCGCLLVDMKVFDDIEMPYFDYRSSRDDGVKDITEDVIFFEKAKAKGYKVMIDPMVKCRHLSVEEIGEENFDIYMTEFKDAQKLIDRFGDGRGWDQQ